MKYLRPIILIVLSLGMIFFYIKVEYEGTITDNRIEIERYDTALSTAKRLSIVFARLLDAYNTISVENRERLNSLLPKEMDEVALLIDLNTVTSNNGLFPLSLEVNKIVKTTPEIGSAQSRIESSLEKTMVKLSVETTYVNLISFIEDLEKSLRIIDIQELSVEPDEDTGNHTFNITFITYSLS